MCMLCRSLFVLFLLAIVLSVLRYTDSDYPFGIFKLFLFLIVDSSQTLQHACRKKIFLYLAQQGKFNKQMIDSLPLPRLLQDYLLFKEYGITHCDLVLDSFNYLCNQS
jgi:hypothetical protein